MFELFLIPDAGTAFNFGPSSEGAEVDAPSIAYAPTHPDQPVSAPVRWSGLSSFDYDYLMAFWRRATRRGANPFTVRLPIKGGADQVWVAKFVTGLTVTAFTGESVTVSATLALIPQGRAYGNGSGALAAMSEVAEDV